MRKSKLQMIEKVEAVNRNGQGVTEEVKKVIECFGVAWEGRNVDLG